MLVRGLRPSDYPALREMYARSGFDFEFPDFTNGKFEAVAVLVDSDDQPLMAAAAERIVQLYLFSGEFEHPAAKLAGVRLLHQALADALRLQGYSEANAFLPPQVERSFGRRLMRTFGWTRNWISYCIRF